MTMGIFVKLPDGTASVSIAGEALSLIDGVAEVFDPDAANLLVDSFGGVVITMDDAWDNRILGADEKFVAVASDDLEAKVDAASGVERSKPKKGKK
jgi:hypothetical protein